MIQSGSNKSKARLVEGPVGKTLVKLTLPMIFGAFSMVAFNLADTFFVGKLGAKELAAMSFTFPVVLFVSSMGMGIGMGAASVISRAIGEGDHHKVKRLTTDSLILSFLLAICFTVIGLFTIHPLFRLLGANSEILPLIKEYMAIWYLGILFLFTPMIGNNAIRATGDTKTPCLIMMTAAGINILLDPFLIFGLSISPKLGLAGAAIATVISRAITFIIVLLVLSFREKLLDFSFPQFSQVLQSWNKILYIGLPSAVTNVIVPLSLGAITSLVATYGPESVAALGVGSRLETLVIMVILSLSATLIPFIGQNWGAHKIDRINSAIKYSIRFSLLWGTSMFFVFAFFSRPIALIFNNDLKVVTATICYLWIMPIGNGFHGIFLLANACLNSVNKPIESTVLTMVRMLLFYIPLAYIGSWLFGLKGVFAGVALSNLFIGIISQWWMKRFIKTARNKEILCCPNQSENSLKIDKKPKDYPNPLNSVN